MDDWVMFPGLLEQSLTGQQPQSYPFGHPLPHEFHPGNEPASQDVTSVQQSATQPAFLHPLRLSQESLTPVPQGTRMVSVTDDELTANATSPPPKYRKKKSPTLRAKDWEPYKARVLELHDSQKLPLVKVKEMIEKEFGFTAELRQYRTRITQWGKDKNIKPAEMTAIVRKRQKRKLVEVDKGEQVFSVRGRNVETHKIDRWMARNEVSKTSLYAPSSAASTPSAVMCRTISELGSMASSPANSTCLSFRSGSVISRIPNPMSPASVSLMPSMGYPQSDVSNIQSPAHDDQPDSPILSVPQSTNLDAIVHDQFSHLHLQQLESRARKELATAESQFGDYHSRTLGLRVELGAILAIQGRHRNAEELTRKAVEDCEKTWNSLSIKLDALETLTQVLHLQRSCDQARTLREQTFELRKVNLGEERPFTVRSMIDSCWENVSSGKINESEELCEQASKISKKTFGGSHLETIRVMSLLVYMYTKQGRLDEAERLGLQSLKKAMAVLGDGHQYTFDCMSRLALVYHKQGRSKEAKEQLRQALKTSVHLYGEDHLSTIHDRGYPAAEYQSQGRLKEAQNLAEQALTAAQRVYSRFLKI